LNSDEIQARLAGFPNQSAKLSGIFFLDFGEMAMMHPSAVSWWREAAHAALDAENTCVSLVAAVAHEDAQVGDTSPLMAFAAEVASSASIALVLRPLDSGYSKEVSGHADAVKLLGFSVDGSTCLYKMTESGILALS
jgi:hypothetical protein